MSEKCKNHGISWNFIKFSLENVRVLALCIFGWFSCIFSDFLQFSIFCELFQFQILFLMNSWFGNICQKFQKKSSKMAKCENHYVFQWNFNDFSGSRLHFRNENHWKIDWFLVEKFPPKFGLWISNLEWKLWALFKMRRTTLVSPKDAHIHSALDLTKQPPRGPFAHELRNQTGGAMTYT